MDTIREIKEEPCLEGTLNEEYQVPCMDFQNEINFKISNMGTKLSNAYGLGSIEIKEEPCYLQGSLNDMKIELEEPGFPRMTLQDEMGCNNDTLMLNGYKTATKTEIKGHLWENRTSEDVKCWTILSLDSDPLSQNGIKDAVSCVNGIEDYPKAQPLRLPADTPCSGLEASSSSCNGQTVLMTEVGVQFETQDALRVGEAFFHEISSSVKSTEESYSATQDDTKPYKCLICGRGFRYSYYLKRHMVVHMGEKLYSCDICEKKFAQKAQLKTHNLLHSVTRPYKCEFCNMSYAQLGNLKRHIFTHSGLKPYKCDKCEKGYMSQSDLNRHMLTHLDVKPLKCDICQKRFTNSSVLTRHKLIHSIIHKCDVCQKTFSRRAALKKHKFAFSHT